MASILAPLTRHSEVVAEALISHCGSLGAVMTANQVRLARIATPTVAEHLTSIRAALLLALRQRVADRPVVHNGPTLHGYLQLEHGWLHREQLRVLYLDAGYRLLDDRLMGLGTVDSVQLHVREVLHHALDCDAVRIIVVHNHPSGSADPSRGDVVGIGALARAAKALDIEVVDALIVTAGAVTSFRETGRL